MSTKKEEDGSVTEDDSDYEESPWISAENDEGRRQAMRESMLEKDDGMNSAKQFMKDFLAKESSSSKLSEDSKKQAHISVFDAIEISDNEDDDQPDDLPSTSNPVVPFPITKRPRASPPRSPLIAGPSQPSVKNPSAKPLGIGRLVQEEMQIRKREALGMDRGRKLGSTKAPSAKATPIDSQKSNMNLQNNRKPEESKWACQVCTL